MHGLFVYGRGHLALAGLGVLTSGSLMFFFVCFLRALLWPVGRAMFFSSSCALYATDI